MASPPTLWLWKGTFVREVSRYSMTYDVMGLPPSLALGVHWTEKVDGDVAVARSRIGEEGGTEGKYNTYSINVLRSEIEEASSG